MSNGGRITRNATALMTSQVVTWLLTFALTIFLPRYLGAEAVGKLNLGLSLWAIAAVGVNFGLDTLLVKEIARQPSRAGDLVGGTLVLRTAIFILAFALMLVYTRVAGYPPETVAVINIIGVSAIVWQWILAVQSALQGIEEMQYMSAGNIAGKGVTTLLGIPLVLLGFGVRAVAATYVVAALIGLAIQVRYLHRLHPIRLAFDWQRSKELMRAGLPHLFSGTFLVVYGQVHVIIIAWLVDEKTVGWYGSAVQLFGTLLFIPTVFTAAVSPTLSRLASGDPAELARLMRRSFDLLLVLSIPIGFGVLIVADPFVALLYGPDFIGSGPVLAILGIALIFMYQNMLIGQFLISTDRQNAFTKVMAVATAFTIPLDILVVPWFQRHYGNGAIGGAITLVVTECGMLAYGLRSLPPGSLGAANVRTAIKVVVAGLVMVAATWWTRPYFVGVPMLLGGVVYVGAVLVLRAVPEEDLQFARGLLARVSTRFSRSAA